MVVSFPNLARVEELRGKETDPRTTSFFLPFPFSFHIKDICHYTPSSSSLSSLLVRVFCRSVGRVDGYAQQRVFIIPGQTDTAGPANRRVPRAQRKGKLYFIKNARNGY